MKIGIIGSGRIGGAIGTHWAQHGHQPHVPLYDKKLTLSEAQQLLVSIS